jgi:Flp pilus assembly protein TadB
MTFPMTQMSALWLPILLSSIFVFIVSSIIHMASPWHKTDYPKLANEEQVMDALRPLALSPGDYFMPRPESMADMKSAEFKTKMERGPRVLMTVMPPGTAGMARELVMWFIYLIVVGILTGYVAAHALPPGAPFRAVIRFAGLVSFIAYAAALWQLSIWYRRSWGITIKATIDSLIYGLVTALTFAYLWPR